MPNFATVFGQKGNSQLDVTLLNALFRNSPEQEPAPLQLKASPSKKERCISILDFRRALSIEVALRKAPVTSEELGNRLQTLDIGHEDIQPDDLERLLGKMPTTEEAKLLLAQADAPERLRDLERQVLPLCRVADAERRLALLHLGLSHTTQSAQLAERFACTHRAASAVLASTKLHNVLRHCLQIANYINHGSDQGAKTFSVASFSAFATFKLGNSSALHYLCLTVCNTTFLAGLRAELERVFEAARESTEVQHEELQAFCAHIADAEAHLATEPDELARRRMTDLLKALTMEQAALIKAQEEARAHVEKAQRFLGERSAVLAKSEVFFSHIVCLVEHLQAALAEVESDPQRWNKVADVIRPQCDSVFFSGEEESPEGSMDCSGGPDDLEGDDHEAFPGFHTGVTRRRKKRISVLADGLSVQGVSGAVNSGASFPGD